MQEIIISNWYEVQQQWFNHPTDLTVWGLTDRPILFDNNNSGLNEDLAIQLGYKVIHEPNMDSGGILMEIGDFECANFSIYKNNLFYGYWSLFFTQYLKNKGINAQQIDNDILIDNLYKVCGTTHCFVDNFYLSAVHISISVNLDNIKKICTKPMVKIPKGLADYGITGDEVKKLFIYFCKEYNF